MENQKILWIVFSITLFLLVVVVVGFIWFLPPDTVDPGDGFAQAGVVSETTAAAFDPIEWVRGTEAVPGLSDAGDAVQEDLLLVIGASDNQEEVESVDSSVVEQNLDQVTTFRVAEPTEPRVVREAAPVTVTSTIPAVSQSAPPAPTAIRVTNYWIQVGSFQSRSRADEVQTVLGEKGFSARITSMDTTDSTYFRVRIGPYESKPEAEKFLGWLKEVDSFGSSYISEVYTTRNAN